MWRRNLRTSFDDDTSSIGTCATKVVEQLSGYHETTSQPPRSNPWQPRGKFTCCKIHTQLAMWKCYNELTHFLTSSNCYNDQFFFIDFIFLEKVSRRCTSDETNKGKSLQAKTRLDILLWAQAHQSYLITFVNNLRDFRVHLQVQPNTVTFYK